MRRLMTLGLISVAALTTACGDDESSGGNGGSGTNNGGSAGNGNGGSSGASNGGSAGATNGGASGATNGGTGGANGGSGGSGSDPDAGDGGGGPPCTGCVELRVPVTAINQFTIFQFALGASIDLSAAIVTYRMRALTTDNQLAASPFAQDTDYNGFEQRFVNLDTGNGFTSPDVWVDIEHNLAAVAPAGTVFVPNTDAGDAGDAGGTLVPVEGDFDKSRVIQFGLNVGSAGGFTGVTDAGPFIVTVLVDSVTFDGIDRPDVTFSDSAEGFAVNTGADQPGSEVIHHPAP